jgi:hypothetical protein
MCGTTKILSLMVHFVGVIGHRPIEYCELLQSGHYTNQTKQYRDASGVAASSTRTCDPRMPPVMALLRDYHAAVGEIIIKYNGTLERYAGDGVMVALEVRDALGALTATWSRLVHDIGFGIGIPANVVWARKN